VPLRQRLLLEVEDIVLNFVDILHEISSLRSSSLPPSPLSSTATTVAPSPHGEMLALTVGDADEEVAANSAPKHRVVKRASSEEVTLLSPPSQPFPRIASLGAQGKHPLGALSHSPSGSSPRYPLQSSRRGITTSLAALCPTFRLSSSTSRTRSFQSPELV
jgi:hypothetical protein